MSPTPNPYEELLHLPHHVSRVHPQMTLLNRAAQFAPFAALVGFGDKVHEQARLTTARRDLDEQARADLDYRLSYVLEMRHQSPEISIEYFVPDALKSGGEYRQISGVVEGILPEKRLLLIRDGTTIPLDDIVSITGDPFLSWDSSGSYGSSHRKGDICLPHTKNGSSNELSDATTKAVRSHRHENKDLGLEPRRTRMNMDSDHG